MSLVPGHQYEQLSEGSKLSELKMRLCANVKPPKGIEKRALFRFPRQPHSVILADSCDEKDPTGWVNRGLKEVVTCFLRLYRSQRLSLLLNLREINVVEAPSSMSLEVIALSPRYPENTPSGASLPS
uniref:Uncharacterized protein n=1 Tax=Parascaris univalens TaxID=6257 RepID=A0A915ATD2_PARUN